MVDIGIGLKLFVNWSLFYYSVEAIYMWIWIIHNYYYFVIGFNACMQYTPFLLFSVMVFDAPQLS